MKSMHVLVGLLLMLLAGCASSSRIQGPAIKGENSLVSAQLARICPTPTPVEKKTRILKEIEDSIAAGVSPDTLATEWERLDKGATACKS
jgi:hypothetical protein